MYVMNYMYFLTSGIIGLLVQDIFSKNMHDFDLDLWNGPKSDVNKPIKRSYVTSYLMEMALFVLS